MTDPHDVDAMLATLAKNRAKRSRYYWNCVDPDPALAAWTDDELKAERDRIMAGRKYLNDLSDADNLRVSQIVQVQEYRRKLAKAGAKADWAAQYAPHEAAGRWPDGSPFPRPGARVASVVPGLFGMPMHVEGIARKRRDGSWYVEVTTAAVGGNRRPDLGPRWKVIESFADELAAATK